MFFRVTTGLIPANEGDGGLDRVLRNGDPPIHNHGINGTHMYSKRVLRTISVRTVFGMHVADNNVHHNGSVDFNDGQ